jgi:predicted phage gp36 major capsid-like protein
VSSAVLEISHIASHSGSSLQPGYAFSKRSSSGVGCFFFHSAAVNQDGVINAGQENYVLLYGDFSNFVIVDRFPSQVELIPNLFGANRRPTGQRGAFLWARTGSDSVVDNSFRVLNVT